VAYVFIVTGHGAQDWASPSPPKMEAAASAPTSTKPPTTKPGARCTEIATMMLENPHRLVDLTSSPAWGPWGVQLAGHWSEGRVLATYEQLRRKYGAVLGDRLPLVLRQGRRGTPAFAVRVSEKSRADADALCAKLLRVGGACAVFRNPRSG
jgi:hypothetical protein